MKHLSHFSGVRDKKAGTKAIIANVIKWEEEMF